MTGWPDEYPHAPGFKTDGASQEAAERIAPSARIIRAQVLQRFVNAYPNGLTADEVAAGLKLSVLTVRPRVSELRRDGRLIVTGERRMNRSGMSATVLRYQPEGQALTEAA